MEANFKYPKKEKLKSKAVIDSLFRQGKTINAFPIKAIYLSEKDTTGISTNVGVSVPKKNFKRAVDRNLLKRRMREAYRINNHSLKTHLKKNASVINIMFIYTAKQILPYKEIEDKIKVILSRLIELSEVDRKSVV